MNYQEWKTKVEKGEIAPLYLFYGEETFLLEESLIKMVDLLVPPEGRAFNYQLFTGKETSVPDLLSKAKTFPFLADRKLLVVRNADELKGDEKILEEYCRNPQRQTVLIFTINQKEPSKGKVFFQIISTKGWTVNFPKLKEMEAAAWIDRKFAEEQFKINRKARDILLERVGANLQALSQEIEKIITFVGKRKNIESADVEAVVGQSKTETLFALADAIGQKKVEESLRILDRVLAMGETHLAIFGMIQRQFRMIWQVKDLSRQGFNNVEIAKKMGQPPWLAQKMLTPGQRFSQEQLNQFFLIFREADLEFKNSDHLPRHILEFLILNLCSG